MEFNSEWLNDLPGTVADDWASPLRGEWEATRNDLAELDERLPLSWYWTLRLAEAFQFGIGAGGGRPLPPGFLWSSVGLVLDSESSLGHFGVVLYVDNRIDTPDDYRDLAPMAFADHDFPVVVRAIRMEDHRSVAAPRPGTVSLAETRVGTQYHRVGWLTAAHVVEGTNVVNYEDGSSGAVLDRGPGCIDVALLGDPNLPQNQAVLSNHKAVAFGTPGSFTGLSGSYPLTVTDVSTSLGVMKASALPVRVGLSAHGVRGDSGARVDANDGSVIGVYLGRYTDANGNPAGLAQMAEQVTLLMRAHFLA